MPPKKPTKPSVEYGWQVREVMSRVCRSSTPGDAAGWVPSVDCVETGDRFLVFLEVPGIDRADIHVELDGSFLRICGRRHEFLPQEVSRVHHVEIDRGRFNRVVPLPPGFESRAVEASLRHGVLRIEIHKEETWEGRVEVREE